MDTKSQIAEKIRQIEESNRKRAEAAEEAERKMAEGGYESKPVVEQVIKEEPKKEKAKSVSVKKDSSGGRPTTADIKDGGPVTEVQKAEAMKAELRPSEEEARRTESPHGSLNESLNDLEKMLSTEKRGKKADRSTVATEPPAPEEVAAPKTNEQNKTPSKFKGPHRKGKVRTKYVDLSGRPLTEFCLVDPLTGEIKNLVKEVTTVGRSISADMVIDNRFVSREHISIKRTQEGWFVTDMNSKNGTKLNGKTLTPGEPEPLEVGDTILLSKTSKIIFDVLK